MKPTPEQITKLVDWHLDHFRNMRARGVAGDRNVRVDECTTYLAIWNDVQSTLDGGGDFDELKPQGRREVNDAIQCGDFDVMLGIESDAS